MGLQDSMTGIKRAQRRPLLGVGCKRCGKAEAGIDQVAAAELKWAWRLSMPGGGKQTRVATSGKNPIKATEANP